VSKTSFLIVIFLTNKKECSIMHPYQTLLKNFLTGRIYGYRIKHHYSQEYVAEILLISPRSYIDLEHGKYGFSAPTLIAFLLLLPDNEVLDLLQDFRSLVKSA